MYLQHKSDILAVAHGLLIPPSPLHLPVYQTPHVFLSTERWLSIAANMCAIGLHFTPNCAVCVWKCSPAMHHCGSPTLTYYWSAFFPPLLLTCWVMSSQCNLTLSSALSRSQPFTPLMYYRWPRGNWGNPAGRELIYSNSILGELNQSQQFSDGVANLTVPNSVPVNKAVTKARLKIGLFWLCWYFLAQLISSLRWSWIVLNIFQTTILLFSFFQWLSFTSIQM